MSQFCHNCGTKLSDDAVFCSGCGTKVKLVEQPMQTANMNDISSIQSVVEPPKAEEPVSYVSPVEPPKAEEPVSYVSPVEPPKAEEPINYADPVQSQSSFVGGDSFTGGNSFVGGASYEEPANPLPPVNQPIPGFGAPGGNANKKNKPKKKKTGLLVFLVIVLILGAGAGVVWFLDHQGIISIFSKEEAKSTYKEAIDLYVKGIEEQDIDTFLDAYGSFLVEEFADGEGVVFMEEVYEEYESEVGEGLSVEYEVTKEKEYSESKLAKLQEELEEDYDFKGTIDKAYDITAEFTIEGDDGETDDKVKFLVVEIEGQWYLAEFDN